MNGRSEPPSAVIVEFELRAAHAEKGLARSGYVLVALAHVNHRPTAIPASGRSRAVACICSSCAPQGECSTTVCVGVCTANGANVGIAVILVSGTPAPWNVAR
jgi:hypothetical protein